MLWRHYQLCNRISALIIHYDFDACRAPLHPTANRRRRAAAAAVGALSVLSVFLISEIRIVSSNPHIMYLRQIGRFCTPGSAAIS